MAQGSFWQRLISFFSGRKEKETSVSVSDKTSPQGTPEAQVTPEVQATPEPQPVPVPQPAPQPAPVPQPAPQPAPVPQPAPQPQAQPVSTPEGSVADGVLKATAVTPVGESSRIFINRELSWLSFNERVLEEAENKQNPFCERLNFACIYQTNLDEFFMVRVGTLLDQIQVSPLQTDGKTNMTAQQQVDAILDRVHRIISRRDALYNSLMAELEEQGLRVVDFHKIGEKESSALEKYFDANVFPFIEPNIVSQKQPFPFLKNKTIYACAVLETKSGKERLGIIPCDTDVFPRLITVGGGAYMLSEELILHFIPKIFSGYKVVAKSLIRVTRNADIDADAMYDEDLDYREFMAGIIKKRKKLQPVRLELSRELEDKMVDVLCAYLDISRSQVFYNREPLDLTFVYTLSDALRQKTELFYTHRVPQRSAQFDTRQSILDQVAQSDKLLFYPYQSFTTFLNFLDEAAQDENVTAIRITLYRVARDSKVVEALIDAAENGKKVLVLVELKARFDEENNIEWSRRLENAGCRVIYGIPGYKVHSKLCLVTRRLNGQNQYLTQIGTGNYNEKTARLYSDLCLFTANQEIGLDALHVFEALTIGETVETSKHLLVAPKCLKNRVLDMIDGQIARQQKTQDGYIGIKLNSLTDKNIMDKLIEASQAGVKIDMVIRGICCLRPGLSGQTDNIRVVSIVGRFLEHARIYIFGRPTPDDPEGDQIYIASADFMTRNTERRVEVGAPILDPSVKDRLRRIFGAMLSDNVQARQMNADGTYTRVQNGQDPMNCQEYFYEKAYEENHEPLPETVR